MTNRAKIIMGVAVALAAMLFVIFVQNSRIRKLTADRDKYRGNSEALLSDVLQYRVRDSLSAARVQSLELSIKEYERFRAADASLIESLKAKNRDLAQVNKTQSETIIALQAAPRDTVVVVKDSIRVPAVSVHCGDAWFDFHGILTADSFTGTLANRDSLLLAETVKYRRFLGFLWKTKKVRDRQLDVVSMNPHTKIVGMEHVIIEK